MSLIKRPNPLALKNAEINRLIADKRALESRAIAAEALSAELTIKSSSLEAELDCADCEDINALQCAADAASYDVLKVQGVLRNELCSNHWRTQFSKCGLSDAFCILQDTFSALLCEREYELSVASHNLAFCKAQGAIDCVNLGASDLHAIIDANPEMDTRCKQYILEKLAVAGA